MSISYTNDSMMVEEVYYPDEQCLEDIYYTDHLSVDRQKFGEILPRISGSLSVVSSALIIILVLRSSTRLSSTYHRIMVGLSTTDILCSTSMAFTHLAFPRMGNPCVDRYSYEGLRLGNTQTCTAQGFFLTFGQLSTYSYNAGLCMYYACAIYFKLRKRTIRNRVEPVIHLVAVTVPFSIAMVALKDDNYNPVGELCAIGHLPDFCPSDGIDCARGTPEMLAFNTEMVIILVSGMFLVLFIGFGLVCWTVLSDSRKIARYNKELQRLGSSGIDSINTNTDDDMGHDEDMSDYEKHKSSNRFILLQALSYISALFITLIFPILTLTSDRYAAGVEYRQYKEAIRSLQLVFTPSQGIFNFIIFFCSKVYQQRVTDRDMSRFNAIKKIFEKNHHDPIIISRLSVVENSTNSNAFDLNFEDYNDEDEEGEETESKKYNSSRSSPDRFRVYEDKKNNDNDNMDGISYSLSGNEKIKGVDDDMEGVSYPSRIVSKRETRSHPSESWSAFSWLSRRTDSTVGRDKDTSAVSSTGLQSAGHVSTVSSTGLRSPVPNSSSAFSTISPTRQYAPRRSILPKTEKGEEGDEENDSYDINPPDLNKRYSETLFPSNRGAGRDNKAMSATGADAHHGEKGQNSYNSSIKNSSNNFSRLFKKRSTLEDRVSNTNMVQGNQTNSHSAFKRRSALEEEQRGGRNPNTDTTQSTPRNNFNSALKRRSAMEDF